MKRILLAFLCGISCSLHAADFPTEAVLLQALDKTTGRTSFLTVKVGEPYEYGDLIVKVEKCMKRPQEETPENSVFINVSEKTGNEIFNGWMFSSNPALSAMEHPVYDIWVIECKNKNAAPIQPIVSAVELGETEEVNTDELED
ncbi:MAG: DUF2155 domain-containing protein [Alphaproteobacteria bacterium]|nr:DUF2155 domain-containing protein [Alphaproteobacteria bacterium]